MVKIVKLQNNVEIIGNINMVDDDKVVIDDPFSINYMISPRSERPVVGLLRYMPFAEERTIEFKLSDVLHVLNARPSMSNYYSVILANHVGEIDDIVDRELDEVAGMELAEQITEDPSDVFSAMLEKLNNNLH